MKEFINSLGYTNFLIIASVVAIIFILLIVVFLLEKKSRKGTYTSAIEELDELEKTKEIKINTIDPIVKKVAIEKKEKKLENNKKEVKEPINIIDIPKIIKEDTKIEKSPEKNKEIKIPVIKKEEIEIVNKVTEKKPVVEPKKEDSKEKVKYDEHIETREEAKNRLKEVTKKLVTEKKEDLEGPTYFEQEQEESSIISYEELKKISQNVDKTNDVLLEDEGNEPITIEELYKKHVEQQDKENLENTKSIDNPDFEERTSWEPKNFHNSELISPVFGIWKNEIKQSSNYIQDDFDKTVELEELETEIKRTEEFLKELKDLKNKLD